MKRSITLRFASAFFAIALLAACGGKTTRENDQASAGQDRQTSVLEVDNLLADAENLSGSEIEVEGVCTHICKHGAGKIFLMGSDDTQTIRIEAGKEVGKFSQDCVNSIVRVKGTLVEQRIDEAYLQRWEAQLKSQTAEKHGGESAEGCSSEQKARGEVQANSAEERIANFRQRIADRKAKDGKEYLSFYFVEATSYQIH